VSYPTILAGASLSQAGVVDRPHPAANATRAPPAEAPIAAVADEPPADSAQTKPRRRRLLSTQDLVELGRLPIGTTLTIRGREGSAARVLDGRHVEFQGERMTFNEWGQRVTGWQAIQIYTWACLPDGRTLDELRDQPYASNAG
jgi:hypothetical protein